MTPARSILARVLSTQLWWSLLWGLAVTVAALLALHQEMDELLDDTLQSAAQDLIQPLVQEAATPLPQTAAPAGVNQRLVWQVVDHHEPSARVLQGAKGAPQTPLQARPTPGFSDAPDWRVFGVALGRSSRMLYVAQARSERQEAQSDLVFKVLRVSVPMAVLALLWLRAGVRRELQPLQALSQRLADYDPLLPGATLGVAEHAELRPVQDAIDALAARLARRVAHERAFTAHAAHALRTPLAGIDAQLAVAVREATPLQQERLLRVRAAAGRLQRVVAALLAMFRRGFEVHRECLDLPALAARLPLDGLSVRVSATWPVDADADLLTAALINLLDNAARHQATTVEISTPQPDHLRVQDDGTGVTPERRRELQQALDAQAYEGRTGLGLMLADLVARGHGGTLQLPAVPQGFAVELVLQPH